MLDDENELQTVKECYLDPAAFNNPIARAFTLLRNAPASARKDPDYWFLVGEGFVRTNCPVQAGKAADRGLLLAHDHIPLLFLQCNCRDALGDITEAEHAIGAALKLKTDFPALLCRYALLAAEARLFKKAELIIAKASEVAPQSEEVLATRPAIAFLQSKQHELRRFSILLVKDPKKRFLGPYNSTIETLSKPFFQMLELKSHPAGGVVAEEDQWEEWAYEPIQKKRRQGIVKRISAFLVEQCRVLEWTIEDGLGWMWRKTFGSRETEPEPLGIDEEKLRRTVLKVLAMLAQRDYEAIHRFCVLGAPTEDELKELMDEYPATFIVPPDDKSQRLIQSVGRIKDSDPVRWWADACMWSAEEGESDLTAILELMDSDEEFYHVELYDLHVM